MARFANATPLIALDAIVLDTETTGLDPAKARIVEIGAVPLKRGMLEHKCRVDPYLTWPSARGIDRAE